MIPADDRARILAAVRRCYDELDARSITAVGALDARLLALQLTIEHDRLPRVLVAGRRGAGKSSLLNALCDEQRAPVGAVEDTTAHARRYAVEIDQRWIEWIDTGGLRAGGASEHRAAMIIEAIVNQPPELVLYVHAASEADAGIDTDLEDLRAALEATQAAHARSPAVLAIATRIDELDPPDVTHPPFDDEQKQRNVGAAIRALRRAFDRHSIALADALAVNTWFSATDDLRWNLPALRAAILAHTPPAVGASSSEARVLYHRVSSALASTIARHANDGDDRAHREWLVATLRRMGPIAARVGDRAELAAQSLLDSPARWLRVGLGRVGVRSIADAVERRSLEALGARVIDAMFDELDARPDRA